MKLNEKYKGLLSCLASLALVIGTATVHTNCMFIFHQPRVPQGLKK